MQMNFALNKRLCGLSFEVQPVEIPPRQSKKIEPYPEYKTDHVIKIRRTEGREIRIRSHSDEARELVLDLLNMHTPNEVAIFLLRYGEISMHAEPFEETEQYDVYRVRMQLYIRDLLRAFVTGLQSKTLEPVKEGSALSELYRDFWLEVDFATTGEIIFPVLVTSSVATFAVLELTSHISSSGALMLCEHCRRFSYSLQRRTKRFCTDNCRVAFHRASKAK